MAEYASTPLLPKATPTVGFTMTELLMTLAVLAVLAAVVVPLVARARAKSRLNLCLENVRQVNRAVLHFAVEHDQKLPRMDDSPAPGGWWHYKEQVKGYAGLTGPSSANDKVFACPDDRGYSEGTEKPQPFCKSKRYVYTSYVFNGVNLPGIPNIAGREVSSITDPSRTLLTMEWIAHAPLSWHRSRTGKANTPFYNDAESVVGFVDGRVGFIKIHYDGLNAAYTRDPAPGYNYKYSGD
jgi:prepilin-type N-terminal cleavage/methylation domain-containing protein